MGTVSYERAPLTVLRVGDSTAEEILGLLELHSEQSFEEAEGYSVGGAAFYLRDPSDRSTVIGLLPSTVLVHDPDRGGVDFVYSDESLSRLGISKRRLLEVLGDPGASS